MGDTIHVALVDDDAAVRDSLQLFLTRRQLKVTCFETAEQFLKARDGYESFHCIVTDVRMPGMSGLDLVNYLIDRGWIRPIIVITGHGDVDMAVSAVKAGAFDFIEKPFDESRLLASIRDAVEKGRQRLVDAVEQEKILARFEALSARQREVMGLAVAGLSSKEIGNKLKISPKTVENHRAWVMLRMGARNVAELVRIAMQLERRV
jgi:FixJ family two-component response regulator